VEAAFGEALAYSHWVEDLVARFAEEPLEEAPGPTLWVVVGPERTFCGGLARRLLELAPPHGRLLLVGRRLGDAVPSASPLHRRIVRVLPAAAGPEEIGLAAHRVAQALLDLDHPGPVAIVHPIAGGTELERASLLAGGPLRTGRAPETYSPALTVLGEAVHEALSGRLVVGLAEALRSEVRARLLAAEAARQGGDRSLEALRHQWRVLRQEAITGERSWRSSLGGSPDAAERRRGLALEASYRPVGRARTTSTGIWGEASPVQIFWRSQSISSSRAT
jgi:hypothetical protein